MKSRINYILTIPIIATNIIVIVAMMFCAYSSHLDPRVHPSVSYFGMLMPVAVAANAFFILFWLIVRRRMVLIPLAGMLSCASSIRTFLPLNLSTTPPEGSIKFMSYNTMAFGSDISYKWEEHPQIQYILQQDADIVCLQESWGLNLDYALKYLSDRYPYQDVQRPRHTTLIILSKFPIINIREIEYSSSSNASYAYDLLIGNDTVLVVNNHFESYKLKDADKSDYNHIVRHPKDKQNEQRYDSLIHKIIASKVVRSTQADSVAEFVESSPCRYKIVCGDFNDPSLSYTHHRFTRTLNDAYTRSGNGPGFSYNRNHMYFRIDNILVSPNIKTYGAVVDKSIDMSDHYPIICTLSLQ